MCPAPSVYLPVGASAEAEFRRYGHRTPTLVIRAGRSATLVTLTLPERVEAGHVEFARALARSAAWYAIEVERSFRGLPSLTLRRARPKAAGS